MDAETRIEIDALWYALWRMSAPDKDPLEILDDLFREAKMRKAERERVAPPDAAPPLDVAGLWALIGEWHKRYDQYDLPVLVRDAYLTCANELDAVLRALGSQSQAQGGEETRRRAARGGEGEHEP